MDLLLRSGETLKIKGLSSEGLRLNGEISVLPGGGDLRIPFQGYEITVPVAFKKGKPSDFLTFGALESRARQMITLFHQGILTGDMASAEKVISRLDTPVDLIPMEEEAGDVQQMSPRWRPLVWGLLYALLALTVFSTLAGRVWSLVDTLPLSTAHVVAPFESLLGQDDGYVSDIRVVPGQEVKAGDVLVVISTPESAATVDQLRSDIDLAERRLERVKKDLAAFLARRDRTEKALQAEVERAIAERGPLESLDEEDMGYVNRRIERLTTFQNAPWPLEQSQIRMHRELLNEVDRETETLKQLRRALGREKAAAQGLNIVAATDGIVTAVHVLPGQFLRRGMPAVDLEQDAPRQVEGMIPTNRASQVYIGMPVRIKLRTPEGARSIDAVVSGFGPADPESFQGTEGIVVELTPTELDVGEARGLLRPGAPVNVKASLGRLDWLKFW